MFAFTRTFSSRGAYRIINKRRQYAVALTAVVVVATSTTVALGGGNNSTTITTSLETNHNNKTKDRDNETTTDKEEHNKKHSFNIEDQNGDKEFWKTEKGKEFLKEIMSDAQESKTLTDSIKNQVSSIMHQASDKITSIKEMFYNSNKEKTKGQEKQGLLGIVGSFSSIVKGGEDQQDALDSIMSTAHTVSEGKGGIQDTAGFSKLLTLMQDHSGKIEQILKKHFEHIDFSYFTPTALWYYLEYEDERKNPSWKRLQHRFHKGIDVTMVEDLNDALTLADLGYVDSPDDLKEGLKQSNIPLQLVYYEMESDPGKPSHYVAVKKGQSWWNNALEIYIVVRGTKTIADAVTDVIMEPTDYRDGKAHAGIVDSGKWLATKHKDLLNELLDLASNKSKIKVTLIGHSLGAGAAAIAGMELNDEKNVDVEVIGFGCPALLSKELSESTGDYITTVICDSDIIPRMSGATIANVALDIMEYDRYPKLHRDAKLAVQALAENYPNVVTNERKKQVLDYIEDAKDDLRSRLLKPKTAERIEVELYPPGKCVHFFRDGHSVSGNISPCDFFGEIDITRTMIDDHLVSTGYGKIFLDLMRVYHDDETFQFDDQSDNNDEK